MPVRPFIFFIPICFAIIIAGALIFGTVWKGRNDEPDRVYFIDREVPKLTLAGLGGNLDLFSDDEILGNGLKAVNFFASWCVPCIAELPVLEQIVAAGIPVYGIAWRDNPDDTRTWLKEHADVYRAVGSGRAGIGSEWGITGIPETFFIYNGRLIYHIPGIIEPDFLHSTLPDLLALDVSNQ